MPQAELQRRRDQSFTQAADGTSNGLTVHYEIRDTLNALRGRASLSQQVGSYPVAIATILSQINAQEGT